MKSNEDFRKALGQPDEYFGQAVLETLDQLKRQEKKESRPQRNYIPRIACTFAALVLVIAGVVLTVRQTADGRVDNIRPTPASAPEDRIELFSSMETDLATITLRKAETDGYGIFLSFAVTPKRKNILVISSEVMDPVNIDPSGIGRTADREGQNVLQWAAEHEYEIFDVSIYSALGEPTCDANCTTTIAYSNLGKTFTLNVHGSALPDVSLYRLYCSIAAWDLSDPEKAGDKKDDHYRLRSSVTGSFITVSVTGETETPELLAKYCLDSDSESDTPDAGITVTCFRTSRAEYMDICTGITDDAYAVYASTGYKPFYSYTSDTRIHGYVRQEDGTILLRQTVTFKEEFPESFNVSFLSYYDGQRQESSPGFLMKKVK